MFRLSVEELAFAIGFLGGAEVAASFLDTVLGKQNKDNLSGRVTAASHSLIARGLLKLDLAANRNELDSSLAKLARAMMESSHSVRGQQLSDGLERTLTCFIHEAAIAAHEVVQGVVSQLETLVNNEALIQRMLDFVQPPYGDTVVSTPLGQISTDMLQTVRQLIIRNKADRIKDTIANYLPETVVKELTNDFQSSHLTWGSILSLATASGDADSLLESNQGILYIALPQQKLWLFQLRPDESTHAFVFRGNKAQLIYLLKQLL